MGGMKIEIEFTPAEVEVPVQFTPQPSTPPPPSNDALRIKAAEYWLKLGEADEALRELEKLRRGTWESASAVEIRFAALGMLNGRNDIGLGMRSAREYSFFRHLETKVKSWLLGVRHN